MTDRPKEIKGFSKLSKAGKLKWLVEHFFSDPEGTMKELMSYWLKDGTQQDLIDGFSENTISNFVLPYGIAPNFLIDGKIYAVPMVIEESSVVAAASASAKFWLERGGFKTTIIDTKKVGQVHFRWRGNPDLLQNAIPKFHEILEKSIQSTTQNMKKRGGGLLDLELKSLERNDLYQLFLTFETVDSMGANFINTILEICGQEFEIFISEQSDWPEESQSCEIIMCILSNYTPECRVIAQVECPVSEMTTKTMSATDFVDRFHSAVEIAKYDVYRATTHNKGIFNGIDSVVLATGNDFRAVEACGHAYAAKDGQYRSLSHCQVENQIFKFWIEIPLSVGTVGGLTNSHPMASKSLELMGHPSAKELMSIMASVGLAQNFAALKSLVTTGIQEGHMKMHLTNILHQLDASPEQISQANKYFEDKKVSYSDVRDFLEK